MSLSNSVIAVLKDLRYGCRQIRRSPGFASIAILTLALGIGANTAVFSVMNAVLLRYLPVHEPQQLMMLHFVNQPQGTDQTGFGNRSLPEQAFEQMRSQNAVLSDLVAFAPLGWPKIPVRIGSDPEEAAAEEVSGNFFSGLGISMVRGRTFSVDDEKDHSQIAVLSHDFWVRRFAADPSVLGQIVFLKGVPFTVVGVAAPEFGGFEQGKATDIWVPFQTNVQLKPWGAPPSEQDESLYSAPKWFFLMMIARLQPGVTPERALAQLDPIYQQVCYKATGPLRPDDKTPRLSLTPVRGVDGINNRYQEPCTVLMAMVGLVLLIACSNVAMLLVARNANRQREFRVRLALGASRSALLRQLLTEGALLVAAGGVLGWLFALFATRALAAWARLEVSLAPDRLVLLFTMALCALAALIFGVVPLRSAITASVGLGVNTVAAASSQERKKIRAGHIVVGAQVALGLMLLVGAGLLVRTLLNLENADLGMQTKGLVVFGISPLGNIKSDADAVHFYRALLSRLRTLPEVESATVLQSRLGSGTSSNTAVYVDGLLPNGEKLPMIRWNPVGPDFFHVLDVPVLLGRDFNDADSANSPRVAIVNQTFAKKYMRNEPNPIGHRLALFGELEKPNYTIVGVVSDSKYTRVKEDPIPMAYLPFTQVEGIASMQVELRIRGNPVAALTDSQRVVKEFGPDLPLLDPITQQEQFQNSFSDERMFARLSVFFGVLAAVLVATGLYGTLAYRVSRRTAEIGVRMALGAQRRQVLWMVLRESLVVSAFGVAVGLPAATVGSRLLRSMLFNLAPHDPLTFVLAFVSIALVTLLAAAIPARLASSVDPLVALRYE